MIVQKMPDGSTHVYPFRKEGQSIPVVRIIGCGLARLHNEKMNVHQIPLDSEKLRNLAAALIRAAEILEYEKG